MEYDRPAMMPIPAGKYPQVWGANMVYRRAALQALGGFDVNLGPVGGRRFCNEDVDTVRRMLQSGRAVAYDPGLTVFHRIPRARLRRAYFRQVMWDMGEGEARAAAEPPGGPRILGIPRWRIRFLARMAVHSTVRTLVRRPGAFYEMLDCVHAAGLAWGQLKRSVRERRARGLLVARRPGGAARAVRAPR
jgi:hypothetical protein